MWLNLVERFFSTLTQKQIHRGVFHSVKDLEQCLETYNENPRPLVWTKPDRPGLGAEGSGREPLELSEHNLGAGRMWHRRLEWHTAAVWCRSCKAARMIRKHLWTTTYEFMDRN